MEELLKKITNWGIQDGNVRAIIQTGSFTQGQKTDQFSDLDLAIYLNDFSKLEDSDEWVRAFSEVLVCLPLKTDEGYPTRLVIFEGGKKVDFSIFPVSELKKLSIELNDLYERGYKALIDKDNLTSKLSEAKGEPLVKPQPTKHEYEALVEEFWFEVWHVAKHLKREDLWHAKSRDWTIKELTLKMIEWTELGRNKWDYDVRYLGVKMNLWASKDIWEECAKIFSRFEATDSWNALIANMDLFERLSNEVGMTLGYEVDKKLPSEMRDFVLKFRK